MDASSTPSAIGVDLAGHVATVVLDRTPHNFLDVATVGALADALEALDLEEACRAVVLRAEGRVFCAGADFSDRPDPRALYGHAMRLFRTRKPIVAAIQGAAIGAGAGLALAADFRIASPSARFGVNFNRLGFHPGFGTSITLARIVGPQHAARLFYTGERIDGAGALAIGLVDEVVEGDRLVERARALARDIATSAPRAVQTTRETLRLGLADAVAAANARELELQLPQFETEDFREGVAAAKERRTPVFKGR